MTDTQLLYVILAWQTGTLAHLTKSRFVWALCLLTMLLAMWKGVTA